MSLGTHVNPGTPMSTETALMYAPEKGADAVELENPPEKTLASPEDGVPEAHAKIGLSVAIVISAVLLIYFTQLLTLVGIGAQATVIVAHFGGDASTAWVLGPVTIMTITLSPILSQASDHWGRKWIIVVSTLFGAVGCLISSRASSFGMLVAGQTILGIGYGCAPLLNAVPSEILPRRYRGWAQALAMISNGLGGMVGTILAGAFNRTGNPESAGFRNFLYLAMGCFALSALLCAFAYRPPPRPDQLQNTTRQKLAKLDWPAAFLLCSGMTLFSLALGWSRNPYPWSDPHVSATFATGIALLVGLGVWETKFKTDGMFHHALFNKNRNFAIAVFCIFVEGIAFLGITIYLTFEVSVLWQHDTLLAGLPYIEMFLIIVVGAAAAGLYTTLFRQVRWITFGAFLLFVTFFACMSTVGLDSEKNVFGYVVFLGIALGTTLTNLVTVAQLSTPPDLIALASGLLITARAVGGTIGIAVYNAVLINSTSKMGSNVAAAVLPLGLPPSELGMLIAALNSHGSIPLSTVEGATQDIIVAGGTAVKQTLLQGFRNIWIVATAVSAVAAFASVALIDPKDQFTRHVDAPLEENTADGRVSPTL